MLTGRPPFGSGPAPQVVQRQLHDPLPPPSSLRSTLSEAVDAVLTKALLPIAKKRWASASTFSLALARALERLPIDHPRTISRVDFDPVKAAESMLAPTAGIDSLELPSVPSQRIVTGRVRAAHLRVLSRLLQHHLGESGMAKMVNETPALAHSLSSTLGPLEWIELADLVAALDRARAKVPSQLVSRKVGRGTMSATFARLFGADPTTLPAETVLAALPTFWARYHDWGDVEVAVYPGSADLLMHGYPGSIDVCAMVAAELERIVELTGAAAVGATHTACACTGANHCEYRLSWTPSP
jgi:hypothetical protein